MPRPLGRSRAILGGFSPPPLPPIVLSVAPVGGGSASAIVVTGNNFQTPAATAVSLVSTAGVVTPCAFVINSNTQITIPLSPFVAPDFYAVRVTGPGGSSTLAVAWNAFAFRWYQAPDYPGTGFPWPGSPSSGPSGTWGNTASGAASGSTVNGHQTMHLAGGTASGSAFTLDNFITTTAIYGAVVFNSSTLPPDNGAGSRILNAALMAMQPSGFLSLEISTAGVGYAILSSFVGYVEDQVPCSLNTWHALQFKYDGSFASCRLDGGAWTAGKSVVPGFNGTNLATQFWQFGTPSYANQNVTADVAEGFLSSSPMSNTDFDDYLAGMRAKYAQPF